MPIIDFRETGGKFINRMHDANKTNTQEDLSRLAVRIGNESLNYFLSLLFDRYSSKYNTTADKSKE